MFKTICGLCLCVGLLFLTGCQNQNRFSTYGSQILLYEGDKEILSNCCNSAICLLADDLRTEKKTDSSPTINLQGQGWSEQGQVIASRMTYSCEVDKKAYRIIFFQIKNRPTMIFVESPEDDLRLLNHLTKLFSNFDVKSADQS